MKVSIKHKHVLLCAMAMLTLACVVADRFASEIFQPDDEPSILQPPGAEQGPPLGIPIPEALQLAVQQCDAREWLNVEPRHLGTKSWDDGTVTCDYEVVFTNSWYEAAIVPVLYVREEDGYADTHEEGWDERPHLAPGKSGTFTGWVSTHTDPDASGPTLLRVERIAAVFETASCHPYITDADYLNWIARRIEDDPCPAPE